MHNMRIKKYNIPYIIIIAIFILIILLPVLSLLIMSFTEKWAWPDIMPKAFSLRAIQSIVKNKETLCVLIFSSTIISMGVASLSVVIGLMSARALAFYDFAGKRLFSFLTIMPFLVPATVFAMGIQLTFLRWGLGNSITGVIIVQLICTLPYAIRIIEDGYKALGLRLEEQARVLGASILKAFCMITIPNLMPVILSSFSMAYIVSFSQYFTTLIIGGGTVKTFAIVMVPYLSSGERNFASIYSVMFLGFNIIVFAILEMLVNRYNKGAEIEYYDS